MPGMESGGGGGGGFGGDFEFGVDPAGRRPSTNVGRDFILSESVSSSKPVSLFRYTILFPTLIIFLSADPELALALRVSMEEQRQRQEEEAKRNQQPAAPKEITIPEDNEEGK